MGRALRTAIGVLPDSARKSGLPTPTAMPTGAVPTSASVASDIAVAAESTTFAQIEVARGILPFGGATIRLPRAVGWGNAMRWILTGDTFDAAEALRIGLVQDHAASFRPVFSTVTCRNRAGTAPCETGAVCSGWPLPQFGAPPRK